MSKICPEHWQQMRNAIDKFGMSGLVAASGEEVAKRYPGGKRATDKDFDPLFEMNLHMMQRALGCYGIVAMKGCPVCLFEADKESPPVSQLIDQMASDMAEFARDAGLISKAN